MHTLKLFIIALGTFLILDGVWLLVVAKGIYARAIGPLMLEKINYIAVGGVYFFLVVALLYFVILPGLSAGNALLSITLGGALLGFIVYGVYDMTNLATLKGWTLSISLIDMAWGTFVSGVVAGITSYVSRLIG
ncbi:MAG: DUF2177 family protein [Candidatus Pacebacteria bacterium]|nr:DUF2177 family protein [Candidatus Paceibacterota bacterium]